MQTDTYAIDSHKLMYHPDRLHQWLGKKDIYPIYMEISPFGSCNHRCIFCALDYLEYRPVYLDTAALKCFLKDASEKGLKSVMFAGEGEPMLHKDLPQIITFARRLGLDTAITTNGTLLSEAILKNILPALSWLRFSLNAGGPKNYAAVHRANPKDFNKVLENIENAARIKRSKNLASTIGVQFLLLNENYKEAPVLAKRLKGLRADYLIIKPYSQHPKSYNRLKQNLDYKKFLSLEKELKKYSDKNFKIIFRKNTMAKISRERPYNKCLGLAFWAYLSSNGDLYGCSAFLGDKRFCYGNIHKLAFDKIWNGKRRKNLLRMMDTCWDIKNCREACRLDEINRYLWSLKNPPMHVNFI